MLLAYIDETGDTGDPAKAGSSGCYALGCVLIESTDWTLASARNLEMRRYFKTHYQVPVRRELKANYLIRGNGTLAGMELPDFARKNMFRLHLKNVQTYNGRAFSVVVDKEATGLFGDALFEKIWTMLIQRLERTCNYQKPKTDIMLFHDNGQNAQIRKLARRSRVHLIAGQQFGTGSVRLQLPVLEDPVPLDSAGSYLIQVADLVAYSGWRSYTRPSKVVAKVVPQSTFGNLGNAIHADVNKYKLNGSIPGVVLFNQKSKTP